MPDVTLHITLPRRQFHYGRRSQMLNDEALGRAIREESDAGLRRLKARADVDKLDVGKIEIVLTDTARAEIADDPEAHTP